MCVMSPPPKSHVMLTYFDLFKETVHQEENLGCVKFAPPNCHILLRIFFFLHTARSYFLSQILIIVYEIHTKTRNPVITGPISFLLLTLKVSLFLCVIETWSGRKE